MKLTEAQRTALTRKKKVFEIALGGENGKALVDVLEETFQTELFDADSHRQAYKVGQYELVEYMKAMAKPRGEVHE